VHALDHNLSNYFSSWQATHPPALPFPSILVGVAKGVSTQLLTTFFIANFGVAIETANGQY